MPTDLLPGWIRCDRSTPLTAPARGVPQRMLRAPCGPGWQDCRDVRRRVPQSAWTACRAGSGAERRTVAPVRPRRNGRCTSCSRISSEEPPMWPPVGLTGYPAMSGRRAMLANAGARSVSYSPNGTSSGPRAESSCAGEIRGPNLGLDIICHEGDLHKALGLGRLTRPCCEPLQAGWSLMVCSCCPPAGVRGRVQRPVGSAETPPCCGAMRTWRLTGVGSARLASRWPPRSSSRRAAEGSSGHSLFWARRADLLP